MSKLIPKYHIAKPREQHGKVHRPHEVAQQPIERVPITKIDITTKEARKYGRLIEATPPYNIKRGYTGVAYGYSTYKRDKPKVGRNALCSCGSGKKNKFCCKIN